MDQQAKAQLAVYMFQHLRNGTSDYSTACNMQQSAGTYLNHLIQVIEGVETEAQRTGTIAHDIVQPGTYSMKTLLTRDKNLLSPQHAKELKDTEKWVAYLWVKATNQPKILRKREAADLLEDRLNTHSKQAQRSAISAITSEAINRLYQNGQTQANRYAQSYGITLPNKTSDELTKQEVQRQPNTFKKAYRCYPDPQLQKQTQRKFRKPAIKTNGNGNVQLVQSLDVTPEQLKEVCQLSHQYKSMQQSDLSVRAAARSAIFQHLFAHYAKDVPTLDTLVPQLNLPPTATDDEIVDAVKNNGHGQVILGFDLLRKSEEL